MSHSAFATFDTGSEIVDRPNCVSVSVIDRLSEIEALRDSWSEMQWHPNSDIDFYTDVVRAWSDRSKPYILVIRRQDVPEAILIGRSETVRIDCNCGYKTLFRVSARQLTFIYGGMLGEFSPENCLTLVETVRVALNRGEADLAEFHFIRTDSGLYRALASSEQIRESVSQAQVHRSTFVRWGLEDSYLKISAKRRKNFRSSWKKLLNDFEGQVTIRSFREPSEMEEMFADVERIACKTYHRRLGVGFDGGEDLRQRMKAEARRGRLRAYVLYLTGQPSAFWIATAYKGVLYSDFMGYDPGLAKYSPGMCLITKTLEGLCAGEVDTSIGKLDWGLGEAQYKEVLGDTSWTEASVRIFGGRPKGLALRLTLVPIDIVNGRLKVALTRSRLLQKVKTRWRRRLTRSQTRGTDQKG